MRSAQYRGHQGAKGWAQVSDKPFTTFDVVARAVGWSVTALALAAMTSITGMMGGYYWVALYGARVNRLSGGNYDGQ